MYFQSKQGLPSSIVKAERRATNYPVNKSAYYHGTGMFSVWKQFTHKLLLQRDRKRMKRKCGLHINENIYTCYPPSKRWFTLAVIRRLFVMIAEKPAIPSSAQTQDICTLAVSSAGSTAANETAKTYPGGTSNTSCKLANVSYNYNVLSQNKVKFVFPLVSLQSVDCREIAAMKKYQHSICMYVFIHLHCDIMVNQFLFYYLCGKYNKNEQSEQFSLKSESNDPTIGLEQKSAEDRQSWLTKSTHNYQIKT